MKYHDLTLPKALKAYAAKRGITYQRYSEFHMRLMRGSVAVLDVWTTNKYYVLTTDYANTGGRGIKERGGQKGFLPHDEKARNKFLDQLFFAADLR